MRLIKLGLVNTNPTVGAFRTNVGNLLRKARLASEQKVTLAVYPEGAISGYYPEDLLTWPDFIAGQWKALELFASMSREFSFPTVHAVGMFVEHEGEVFNTIAVVCRGRIVGGHFKENLPSYGVFYEGRHCSPGRKGFVVKIAGVRFGDVMFEAPFGKFSIDDCEDVWNGGGPLMRRAYSGSEVNCTANASPWRIGVMGTRREMLATRSADSLIVQAYSNLVGANDGLIFDGGGFVHQNGVPLFEGTRWEELLQTCVVDLDQVKAARMANKTWRSAREDYLSGNEVTKTIGLEDAPAENYPEYERELWVPKGKSFFMPSAAETPLMVPVDPRAEFFDDIENAIVLGTVDYIRKTGAFKCLGNNNSGGKDSAVTSILLWRVAHKLLEDVEGEASIPEAIANGFLTLFSMPSRYNSEQTKSLSRKLAEELGARFVEEDISEALAREIEVAKRLAGVDSLSKVAIGNIQTRIRFTRLWNWANASGGFIPQNSNMSEKAVGYCTVGGGDIEGHLSMIANLSKTDVTEFLLYLGRKYDLYTAQEIYYTKASAELEEGQTDEGDLMPFPVLDACFYLFAKDKLSPLDIYLRIRHMFDDSVLKAMRPDYKPGMLKAWVKKFMYMFMRSIFKWVRTPLSLHLGSLDLERERAMQIPVVQSMEWFEASLRLIDDQPD